MTYENLTSNVIKHGMFVAYFLVVIYVALHLSSVKRLSFHFTFAVTITTSVSFSRILFLMSRSVIGSASEGFLRKYGQEGQERRDEGGMREG